MWDNGPSGAHYIVVIRLQGYTNDFAIRAAIACLKKAILDARTDRRYFHEGQVKSYGELAELAKASVC